MNKSLLEIADLQVTVEDRVVIKDLSLKVGRGEVVVLLGANGSGKSSLVMALMGNPNYKIPENLPRGKAGQKTKELKIELEGRNLLKMSSDERAKAGLYVAWQNPVTIPGVSVFNLCKSSYESMGHKIAKLTDFKHKLEELVEKVGLPKEYISRNVNEGFSGGEKKRLEMLQLLLLQPKLAILDEIDSGLDARGVKVVVEIIDEMRRMGTSFILITHNKNLLDRVSVDTTWEIEHGQLQTRV